jgi:hypothetical protein
MRLNLDRVQRAAENQPQEALNDSSENACLASFKRSNSGHRGYLSFLRWREAPAIERDSTDELWGHLVARPVIGYRSTCPDDRDVSYPVAAEPAAE